MSEHKSIISLPRRWILRRNDGPSSAQASAGRCRGQQGRHHREVDPKHIAIREKGIADIDMSDVKHSFRSH